MQSCHSTTTSFKIQSYLQHIRVNSTIYKCYVVPCRFDRRLTAIGQELELSEDYSNLPARQWHTGYEAKAATLKARVHRLSVRPRIPPKPSRLIPAERDNGTATDKV